VVVTFSTTEGHSYTIGTAQHALAPDAVPLRFAAQVKRRPLGGALKREKEIVRASVVESARLAGTCACKQDDVGGQGGFAQSAAPPNMRFQPTASLAALASRRLKRVPLACFAQ
jgi:hypothetical protein